MENLDELIRLGENISILYVEDDDAVRDKTKSLLERFFPKLKIGVNGKEGLDLFKQLEFDIIISDIRMPQMNGIEMVKAMREVRDLPPTYIISAHDDSEYLMELINLRVQGFIPKPTDFSILADVLLKTCRTIISNREIEFHRQKMEEQMDEFYENTFEENGDLDTFSMTYQFFDLVKEKAPNSVLSCLQKFLRENITGKVYLAEKSSPSETFQLLDQDAPEKVKEECDSFIPSEKSLHSETENTYFFCLDSQLVLLSKEEVSNFNHFSLILNLLLFSKALISKN